VPFSVVDEAIHLLDTESEPWSIQLEARVEGSIDEARLRAAVADGLSQHPMARARKVPSLLDERRFYWEITPGLDVDPVSVVECADDDALAEARSEFQSRRVPLAESPPLRVRLARHPDGDSIMVNLSHTAFDGFGCLRVLNSIVRAYRRVPDPLPDLDPLEERQVQRSLPARDPSDKARRLATLGEKLRDVVAPTARLAREGGRRAPGYGFHQIILDEERTKALTDLDLPGTVNDVLLAALHLAIAAWNQDHDKRSRRIGVLMPVNLRPKEWWEEVAGNFSLMVRVATDSADRSSVESVMKAVSDQSTRIKQGGTGAALIEVLGGLSSVPVWFKQGSAPLASLFGRRLVDTAILTNLGLLKEPPSFGPEAGETTELWFSAPARMPLGLSLGVVTAGGRLFVVFRYRHVLFGPEAAGRFAERYLEALDSIVEASESAPAS
jgi:NRPS condensation-like uncharacterized protein